MNDGTKDPDPSLPADAEEIHAANALREALEGRPGGVEAPAHALEAAALLRSGGPAAHFSDARRAALRTELLASLPKERGAPRAARAGLPRSLALFLPLAGGAAAVIALGIFATRSSDPLSALASAARTPGALSLSAPVASPPLEPTDEDSARALSVPTEAPERSAPRAGSLDVASEAELRSGALARRVTHGARATAARARKLEAGGVAKLGTESLTLDVGALPRDDVRPEAESPARAGTGALERLLPAPSAAAAASPAPGSAERGASAASIAAARALDERLRSETLRYRSRLLLRLADGRVDAAYADLDRAHSGEQLRAVQAELTALSSGALGGSENAADAERVRQDIFCRLAEVALRLRQPAAALDWTRRGLELATAPNPFAARLHQLAGQAEEAVGDRKSAAKSYAQASEINGKLLDEGLERDQ